MTNNRHGLSRDIPEAVKRAVRQRDGFGCVLCGFAVYTYEHIDPTFEHATEHNPAAITLLCAQCHDRVTRGLLSKETVKSQMVRPKCREEGFSFGPFDVGSSWPTIRIGPITLDEVAVIIQAAGDDILRIDPPEDGVGPFRISAFLSNSSGTETLSIVENEWRSSSGNWDVEVVGPRITVRDAPGDIALVLRAEPPNGLVVERLNMYHRGVQIQASANNFSAGLNGHVMFSASSARFKGNAVGIAINSDGSGHMGVGGGSVYIGHMVVNPTTPFPLRSAGSRPVPRPLNSPPPLPKTRPDPKPGRNQPCACGSGRKYKFCCGRPATA